VLQPQFLTVLNPEEQVAASHPLRAIRKFCDEALRALSPTFEERHSDFGRAFIAPQPSGGRFERICQPGARPEDGGHTPGTVGTDKGSHTHAFVQQCRDMGVQSPVTPMEKRRVKGAGRTHHPNARAHNQSTHPQRNRGTLRLVQSGRRAAANPVPRRGQRSRLGLIHRDRLQSCPYASSGSRPAGQRLRPPRPLDPESKTPSPRETQQKPHPGAHQRTSHTFHRDLYSTAKVASPPKRLTNSGDNRQKSPPQSADFNSLIDFRGVFFDF